MSCVQLGYSVNLMINIKANVSCFTSITSFTCCSCTLGILYSVQETGRLFQITMDLRRAQLFVASFLSLILVVRFLVFGRLFQVTMDLRRVQLFAASFLSSILVSLVMCSLAKLNNSCQLHVALFRSTSTLQHRKAFGSSEA